MPEQAKSFIRLDTGPNTTFKVSDLVAQQTGITAAEKKILEEKVQEMVLAQLKEVEQRGYQEAYELGLEVGRKEAFERHIQQYKASFDRFDQLLLSLQGLASKLVEKNESRILELVMKLSEKLALDHIKENKEVILKVLKSVFADFQNEESVTIKLSEADTEFIEEVKMRVGFNEDMKFLEGHKIEAKAEIKDGGCLIETNYGVVDATIEERFSKLWTEIKNKIPSGAKEA